MANKMRRGKGRPSGRGTTDSDALVALIAQIVAEETADMRPRFGVVKGVDGENLRIRPWADDDSDDEDRPRESRARMGGGRSERGDMVMLFHMGDGLDVAVPVIREGRTQRIDSNDIRPNAIKQEHIHDNAIGAAQVQGDAIKQHHLSASAIKKSHFQQDLARDFDAKASDGRVTNIKDGFDRELSSIRSRIDDIRNKIQGGGN